jgi:hypothetical protein
METSNDKLENNGFYEPGIKSTFGVLKEVYRVIDGGDCVLTTLDPRKALIELIEQIDKHDITACWAEIEELK